MRAILMDVKEIIEYESVDWFICIKIGTGGELLPSR
jgi:hypothetical protein